MICSMSKIRVFINGFGRIGRSVLRIMLDDERFEVVGINDIIPVSQFKYLLQYDSVYQNFPRDVQYEDGMLLIGFHRIGLFCCDDLRMSDFVLPNVDLLLQCSGQYLTIEDNKPLLERADKIIISAPAQDMMPTYIMGFNHQAYRGERIVSTSSCSANAIAPIMQIIEERYGIECAAVSMIHSYTNDQNLLDSTNMAFEPRRQRSATHNILPLQSTATSIMGSLFPHLNKKIYTKSIRVPVHATTLYDFTLTTRNQTDSQEINALFLEKSQTTLQNIIDTDDTYKVSSDYIQNRHSATIDLPLTEVLGSRCVKLSAWQDNEYGYAYQLMQMAQMVASKKGA